MIWARKATPEKSREPRVMLMGLDINASRARAMGGMSGAEPQAILFEEDTPDLPVMLNLEARQPLVGIAAARVCRQWPHLVCTNFLHHLGDERQWRVGRHRLDAAKATRVLMESIGLSCGGARGVVFSLPPYLNRAQVALLPAIAKKAKLPLIGCVRAPLAYALSAHTATAWTGAALVVDVDDHALSATCIHADGRQLALLAGELWPALNRVAWKNRLVHAVAERCIRLSRRDPRECAAAEQALYDQLEGAFDSWSHGQVVELMIQTPSWYQNLFLQPKEISQCCSRLVNAAAAGIDKLLTSPSSETSPRLVLVTHSAARLPGLLAALQESMGDVDAMMPFEHLLRDEDEEEDEPGSVMTPVIQESGLVRVLSPDAGARAAHALSPRFLRGEFPQFHVDAQLPLASLEPAEESKPKKASFRIFPGDIET